jgi:hypothetical protein
MASDMALHPEMPAGSIIEWSRARGNRFADTAQTLTFFDSRNKAHQHHDIV